MPTVFETTWFRKTLAKGDKLLVPTASKQRRTLWQHAQMPSWDAPRILDMSAASTPWWLLQKGHVLEVLARPSRHFDKGWVKISFKDGECTAWILSEHAYACPRHRAATAAKPTIVALPKDQIARLSDLRIGVVFEYNNEIAIVHSWSTDKLSTVSKK